MPSLRRFDSTCCARRKNKYEGRVKPGLSIFFYQKTAKNHAAATVELTAAALKSSDEL
jgi:hypothetical protein